MWPSDWKIPDLFVCFCTFSSPPFFKYLATSLTQSVKEDLMKIVNLAGLSMGMGFHENPMENVPWDGMGQHELHFPWDPWDSSHVTAT